MSNSEEKKRKEKRSLPPGSSSRRRSSSFAKFAAGAALAATGVKGLSVGDVVEGLSEAAALGGGVTAIGAGVISAAAGVTLAVATRARRNTGDAVKKTERRCDARIDNAKAKAAKEKAAKGESNAKVIANLTTNSTSTSDLGTVVRRKSGGGSGSGSSRPSAGKPSAGRPSASRPSAGKPSASKPSASKPSASRPSASKPSASKPNAGKPSASKPNAGKPGNNPSAKKPRKPKKPKGNGELPDIEDSVPDLIPVSEVNLPQPKYPECKDTAGRERYNKHNSHAITGFYTTKTSGIIAGVATGVSIVGKGVLKTMRR